MTKRLLTIVMSVLMIMSVFCAVPVSAVAAEPDLTKDYVAGVRTGNFITDTSATDLFRYSVYNPSNTAQQTPMLADGIWTMTETIDTPASLNEGNGSHGVFGANIQDKYFEANNVATGKTIVFGVKVKATAGTPQVKAAYNVSNGLAIQPVEYPDFQGGQTITDTENWTDVGNTLIIDETYFNTLRFGFAYTGIENEGARGIQIKADSMYIGEEYAYDMIISASGTKEKYEAGDSFTVTPKVINQVYSKGTLSQNVQWYVMNASRTGQAEGISVTAGENGAYTVAIAENAAVGTYHIVAVSQANTSIVKSVPVTVAIDYSDYVPGARTGNFITDTSATDLFRYSVHNPSNTAQQTPMLADGIWTMTETIDTPASLNEGNGSHGVFGANIQDKYFEANNVATGKTIVFGVKVKATAGTPQVKAAYNVSNGLAIQPVEYPDFQGGQTITDTENWTDVGNTLIIDETYFNTLRFGFAYTGIENEGARGIQIKADSMYIGEEYVYDITVDSNKKQFTLEDKELKINYGVINQVYSKGTLSQDVVFKIMNKERTESYTEDQTGIKVVDDGKGTATVTFDPYKVAIGYDDCEYDIVAYSSKYKMAKGVTVSIPKCDVVSELTLTDIEEISEGEDKGKGTVTANVKLYNRAETPVDAVLVVILVNDKNQLVYKEELAIADLKSSDGEKTYSKTISKIDLSKVTKAKAFLLECNCKAEETPALYNSTLTQLAPSDTKDKK